MTLPFSSDTPSESELRIAQAQLVGWLEGLFHGIQATLFTQQMQAQRQFEDMRSRRSLDVRQRRRRTHPRRVPLVAMTCTRAVGRLRLGTRELAAPRGRAPARVARRGRARTRHRRAAAHAAARVRGRSAIAARVARRGEPGRRLPAARRRLRGVVRGVHRRQHPRQAQGDPADVGGADVQHRRPDGEGRPHRGPVRQAPLVAGRNARRAGAAVVLRRHRQRLRVRRDRPPARPAAHAARLQPGRGDAQPAARVHEGRLRRPQPRAPVEPRVHRVAAGGPALRRGRRRHRAGAALHGRVRHRPRARGAAARGRLLHVARSADPRLRGGAHPPRQPHRRLVRLLRAPVVDRRAHPPDRRRARGVPLRRAEPDRREARPDDDARRRGRAVPPARSRARARAGSCS